MTSSDDQNECPLCMEPLEVDDSSFYPCTCGYQICRFCWHRLKTDGNGLCPACRKPYSDNPAHFEPLSEDEIIRIKKERRQKELQKKQRLNENRLHLADVRVVQKNLVFVVGLSQRLADAEVLKKNEYFGRFGKILKVVINPSPQYAGTQIPSASAYLTYSKAEEALRAIQTVNNIQIDNRTLKASLGTTKYCSHFLKSATCPKQDCMYLHDFGEEAASFTKEEMSQGKHLDYESKLIETILHIPKNLQNISPINSNTNTNLNTQVSTTEVSDAENSENTEYKSKYKGKVNGTSNGISNYNRPTKSQHNLNQKSTVSANTTESVQTTPNDTNKLKQSSSATSLSVNTNTTDLITCSSLNNLNTQSTSSSSSSSSSLTPPPTLLSSQQQQQQQKSTIQQQSQTIHHQSADSNNNISASNNQILANNSQYLNGSSDLNNKNQIELLTNGSLENQNNYIQHHHHQQPQSQQQNLFHEEDLGFDPWCESTRALQDLMQIENQTNTKYTNQQQHQQNNINYLSSKLANSSLSQPNANILQSHIEYLQKQFLSKPDLIQTNTFQNTTSPSLESLLSLQHNSLLSNSLLNNAPLTNSLNSLLLTNQPKTIVPPPGFANTKFPSSTSTSNSSSTNSSASSSVNNSASSTPSMNNLSNNNKANNLLQNGSTGNLNALKSIFPNANISFGNNVNHNLNHSNQMNNNYKLSNNTHANNYWPDDPAIISLTDPINLLNGNSGGIGSLSEFNTNLSNRSLSPGLLNGSSNNSSGIKSSFYDNFSSLQNSYSNSYQQNFENIAKLQQIQQFMLQQQFNSSINIDHHAQQQQQQLHLLKSLQNSNQNMLSNGGLNSFASLQQQLLLQQLSSFQMNTNPMQTAATGSKATVDD